MSKKIFTKVSAKAAAGIRKVYESEGYKVRLNLQDDGSITVVASKVDEPKRRGLFSKGRFSKSRPRIGHEGNVAA